MLLLLCVLLLCIGWAAVFIGGNGSDLRGFGLCLCLLGALLGLVNAIVS